MGLKKTRTIDLSSAGYKGVTVEVSADWRISSLLFPNPAGWDIALILTAMVNGEETQDRVKVYVDDNSSPPIWDALKLPLTKPERVETLGELLLLVNRELYAALPVFLPELAGAEKTDPGELPQKPVEDEPKDEEKEPKVESGE